MKRGFLIIALLVIAAAAAGVYYWQKIQAPKYQACTMEAKLCPDGSAVGRTGPKCEFAPCPPPAQYLYKGWKTSVQNGISFKYLPSLGTTYLHPVSWPPSVQVLDKPYICSSGGNEIETSGQTQEQTINGNGYCVTKQSEGAAGSIYTTYAYAFAKEGKTIVLSFTLRFVQCANYVDPQKTTCERERRAFNIDPYVDAMARSVKL
jgi:hypothetical protein